MFIPGIFLRGGGRFTPPKRTIPPQRLPNCVQSIFQGQNALTLFSAGAVNYKCITETLFQWTINTGTYSSLIYQKGAN